MQNIISQNNCGYSIKHDTKNLAFLLNEIASSREIDNLGNNAREAFDKKFAMPIAINKWIEVLNSL